MTKGRGKRAGSRGKKKESGGLDLFAELDIDALIAELGTQSDRGVALIAGEVVNAALQLAIAAHFRTGADQAELFFRDGAPIAQFSARAKVADGLGIISRDERKGINALRKIRNHFAHGVQPHTFDEPSLKEFFDALEPTNGTIPTGPNWSPLRRQYVSNCLVRTGKLLNAALFKRRAPNLTVSDILRAAQGQTPEEA